jgi:glycosyltransferase EpsH
MTSPKVSIVVPVYNVKDYIHRCIDSLIHQTLKDIEIILIDDGSTDNSRNIIDEYASKDKRIRTFHIENAGVSNARNIGISESLGEYIMFLDSDDWIDFETCEVGYSKALETGADILFWSWQKESPHGSYKDFYLENNSSILSSNEVEKLKIRCVGLLDDELRNPIKTDHFTTPWAKLYKRIFIIETNVKFIERKKVGMEDVLFNIEVFQKVKKVAYLANYFNHYRIYNPNSLTKTDTNNLFTKFNNLFDAIGKIENNHPRFKDALNNRIAMSLINIMLSITNDRNLYSFKERINQIKRVIYSERIKHSLKSLALRELPFHWKVFFLFSKYRFVFGIYIMTMAMSKLRKKKV